MTSFEDKNKEEVCVILVAFSVQGHINPLLMLGKNLLSKGLHATLVTTELIYHRVFKSTIMVATPPPYLPSSQPMESKCYSSLT
ncbi:putative hydroxycinnamate 4-beta-glucosyltransferase [Lupinus albus]|uniref:Putative hydroxycinnamate 4-beta-glucosyltransferase n=1 Tax=Lupinus albus TaxID=3870 RepID=A0A6A4QTK3_LUPAL|nr:putative hydroxycinnamate 4-beta-glucosyltransferase [Lupinus albus]